MKKNRFMYWICLSAFNLIVASCSTKNESGTAPIIKVQTELVQTSRITQSQPYVGVVEEEESTALSFTLTGNVQAAKVSEGRIVSKGEVLATLDPSSARSALEAASATLSQAKDAYNRMDQLHKNASLPEIKMVEFTTKLQQAQSGYDIALKNYKDCSLRAPFGGVIGKKYLSPGETVMPGQPVLTLLNIDKVKISVSIPETEISHISSSDSSVIRVAALNNRAFSGGKIEKGVVANSLTHTYNIHITLPNPGKSLLPGMVCSVQLSGKEETSRITVPARAVQCSGNDSLFVWKAANGTAIPCRVLTGEMAGNRITITEGLSAGDRVIIDGYQKVSNGSKIVF